MLSVLWSHGFVHWAFHGTLQSKPYTHDSLDDCRPAEGLPPPITADVQIADGRQRSLISDKYIANCGVENAEKWHLVNLKTSEVKVRRSFCTRAMEDGEISPL